MDDYQIRSEITAILTSVILTVLLFVGVLIYRLYRSSKKTKGLKKTDG